MITENNSSSNFVENVLLGIDLIELETNIIKEINKSFEELDDDNQNIILEKLLIKLNYDRKQHTDLNTQIVKCIVPVVDFKLAVDIYSKESEDRIEFLEYFKLKINELLENQIEKKIR